jgi:3-oxoacyl-[acyl-carrier protein] reductase
MMGPENPFPYRAVPFWELDFERFRRTVDVNGLGAYVCARVVVPDMVARRQGLIINVSTSDHTKRSPEHIPYGPSKAMMEMFSLAAAKQLEPFGVRLNVVEAGGRVNQRGESNPNNQPYDCMVPLILYLASNAARDVTGQVFSASAFNASRPLS